MLTTEVTVSLEDLDDRSLVDLACQRDDAAFRLIMQRHNRRLYRVARSILRDEEEAEDVVQESYVRAFVHLADFRGDARLSTWLTRIVVNEASGRLRRRRSTVDFAEIDRGALRQDTRVVFLCATNQSRDPEVAAATAEIRRLIEGAIDGLPEPFRVVFVMRDVEGMSIEETASHLELRPETVKTRLHRARRLLRQSLGRTLASAFDDAFPFAGARCARITATVLGRVGIPEHPG